MEFVFTACDQAANEPCPVWPGQPMTAYCVAAPSALIGVGNLFELAVATAIALFGLAIGHRCLEEREQMLRSIGGSGPFDPFPAVDSAAPPKIRENELYWVAGAAILALIAKLVIVCMKIA